MAANPLATYLHDHLAGARSAVGLIKDLRDDHAGEPLGDFAAGLLPEIEEDRATLRQVASAVGGQHSKFKEAVAWAASKVSRLKLGRTLGGDFAAFQALETLALGVHGKLVLWRALAALSAADVRLRRFGFDHLASRAEAQYRGIEERRIRIGQAVFRPTAEESPVTAQ